MKCRMKRVASLFLALALCAGMTMNVGAVTVQEAEELFRESAIFPILLSTYLYRTSAIPQHLMRANNTSKSSYDDLLF